MKRSARLALPLVLALAVMPAVAQYCASTSSLTNCVNLEEYIANVTIGSLNNSSACMNAPAYEDYTGLAAPTLTQLQGTQITVTVGNWFSSTDTVTVFFDWNGNNVLNDAGEVFPLLQGTGNSGGNTLYTGTITPPSGAASTTRMRVKTVYGSSANPCGSSSWSNTEDYTVNTLPPTGLVASGGVSPNPSVAGTPVLFTVAISASTPPNPPTGVSVTINLSSMGGSAAQAMVDDGSNGDAVAGDNTFSWTAAAPFNGNFTLPFDAIDSVARTANGTISYSASPVNDTCAFSTLLSLGANGPFTNVLATDGAVAGSCATGYKDVWFAFIPPCTGPYRIDTCGGSPFDTVLTAYSACGSGELACNNNAPCGGSTVNSVIPSVSLTAGVPIFIRVASNSSTGTGSFMLNVEQVFTLTYGSTGPGNIGFLMTGGPQNGTYYLAIAFSAQGFPNGWFFGVDMLIGDIVAQVNMGYPFVGALDFCGNTAFGPIGAPTGLQIWSVAVASNGAFLGYPTKATPAVTYTIP
jgi:hypothetical protein